MKRNLVTAAVPLGLSSEDLQDRWRRLNVRYFSGLLPPIPILWSRRLTSSVGMFASQSGPRARQIPVTDRNRREIRLSLPLLERLAERTPYAEQELLNTLAHEMIHQWQFDVLKRRPNHGLDFLRKMTEINRSGEVAITTYHSLQKEVLALSRFAWRCTGCGRVYRRQRRTIEPAHHHCGVCRGALQELRLMTRAPHGQHACRAAQQAERRPLSSARPRKDGRAPLQLTLAFA
jgi:predicted SprT family Zn-dependent metalloprotease